MTVRGYIARARLQRSDIVFFLITEAKSSFVDHNLRIQLGKTSADERTSRIDVSDTSTQINAVQCHYYTH